MRNLCRKSENFIILQIQINLFWDSLLWSYVLFEDIIFIFIFLKAMSFTEKMHIGIILDGNRTWARGKGLDPLEGHNV